MDQPNNDQEAIIQKIEKFKKHLDRTNMTELIADITLIAGALFGAYFLKDATPSLPIGYILLVLGAIYQFWFIFKYKLRRGTIPPKEDRLQYLSYWLKWYENTYDLARSTFWWMFLPIIPGLALTVFGFYQIIPENIFLLLSMIMF